MRTNLARARVMQMTPAMAFGIAMIMLGCDPVEPGDPMSERAYASEADTELALEESEDEPREHESDGSDYVTEAPDPNPAPPTGPSDAQNEADPQSASPSCTAFRPATLDMNSCEWVKTSVTSGTTVRADCDNTGSLYYVITGGCWTFTSGKLTYSAPDEGSQGDLPEDGTGHSLSTADGWSCSYDTSASAMASHKAVALCCTEYQPAICE